MEVVSFVHNIIDEVDLEAGRGVEVSHGGRGRFHDGASLGRLVRILEIAWSWKKKRKKIELFKCENLRKNKWHNFWDKKFLSRSREPKNVPGLERCEKLIQGKIFQPFKMASGVEVWGALGTLPILQHVCVCKLWKRKGRKRGRHLIHTNLLHVRHIFLSRNLVFLQRNASRQVVTWAKNPVPISDFLAELLSPLCQEYLFLQWIFWQHL